MAEYTTNLNLEKPDGNENFRRQVLNDNMDKIDAAVAGTEANLDAHEALTSGVHGAVPTATANRLVIRDANGRAQVAAPSAAADIARKDTVDAVQANLSSHLADYVRQPGYGTTAGTLTAYTLTLSPALTAYAAGVGISVKMHVTCGASPTININGLGARSLRQQDNTNFAAGDLVAASIYTFRYDGTNFLADSSGEIKSTGQTEESYKFTGAVNKYDPMYVTDNIRKLANPSTLPPGLGYSCAFDPTGTYLAVGHQVSPYITIYKRSGDTFTKLANPSTLPPGLGYSCAFDPTGTYLVVGHYTSPCITIYKRSGDTFTKLADPSTLPTGSIGYSCAFDPTGTYLAVGHQASPCITIYKRSGDTFTKLANPSTLPPGLGYSCAFDPTGTYLAVGHYGSPYITIYKRSGDTFTKLVNSGTLPPEAGYSCAFDPTGTYLAVGHPESPCITIYKRSGDTFTKLANPSTLPPGLGYSCAFDPTGTYLAVGHPESPYITIYKRSGDIFITLANPSTLPPGLARSCAFARATAFLVVGHQNTPYVTIYSFFSATASSHIGILTSATKAGYAKESGTSGEIKKCVILWR